MFQFLLIALVLATIAVCLLPDPIRHELHRKASRFLQRMGRWLPRASRGLASDAVQPELESIDGRLKEVSEHIEAVRGLAEDRGRELERLREGYDFAVTRSFARGVIKAIDLVHDFKEQLSQTHGKRNSRALKDALSRFDATESQLLFLLEAHQIESFTPSPGDAVADDSLRFEPVETRAPESAADIGRVAEVKYPGYALVLGDSEERVIRPAQVSVFGVSREGRPLR